MSKPRNEASLSQRKVRSLHSTGAKWSSSHSLPAMVLPSLNMSPNTTVRINLLHAERLSLRVWLKKDRWSTILTVQIRNCFNHAWREYRTKFFRNGRRSSYAQSNGTCMWHTSVYEVETTRIRWGTPTHPFMDLAPFRLLFLPLIVVSAMVFIWFATKRTRDEVLSGVWDISFCYVPLYACY